MLTVSEAAARLSVSPRRVQQYIRAGQLAAERHGRWWLIEEQALAQLQRRPGPGRPPRPA